jgi:hypothetical protein
MADPTEVFGVMAADVPIWRNFVAVYDGSSELERRRGERWYLNAWRFSRALAETHWHHGTQRRTIQAAAIVAALGQQTSWERNQELALEVFAAKGELDGGTFEAVRDKCSRLFHGAEPYRVLGGPKITAFFACIAAQGECADVTVDRHIAHIAYGQILADRDRNNKLRVTKSRDGYEAVAHEVRAACAYVNQRDSEHWSPAKFQAVVWISWRNVLLGEERGFRAPERDLAVVGA